LWRCNYTNGRCMRRGPRSNSWCRPLRQGLNRRHAHWRTAVIFAGKVVPANAQHLLEHVRAVDQRMDAGSSAVSPKHWNLRHTEAELARQKKYLRVEAPALDALQRKNGLRGAAGKRFKAALGVGEVQTQNHAQQEVKDSSKKLPMQGLALGLQLDPQPA